MPCKGRDEAALDAQNHSGPGLLNPVLFFGEKPHEATELSALLTRSRVQAYFFLPSPNPPEGEALKPGDWSEIVSFHEPLVVLGQPGCLSLGLASLLAPEWCRGRPRDRPMRIFYEFVPYWIERDVLRGQAVFRRSRSCERLTFIAQEQFQRWLSAGNRDVPGSTLALPAGADLDETYEKLKQFSKQRGSGDVFFPWPRTDAKPGSGFLHEGDWPEDGLLSRLGYTVAADGPPRSDRLRTLSRTFLCEALPAGLPQEYVAEWGGPNSAARLRKMAETLAALCRNAKRKRRALMGRSVGKWEDDLAWLKKTYYDGRFDGSFRWPNT